MLPICPFSHQRLAMSKISRVMVRGKKPAGPGRPGAANPSDGLNYSSGAPSDQSLADQYPLGAIVDGLNV